MKINNVNFGSRFQFDAKQLQAVSQEGQNRVVTALKEYAGVGKRHLDNLFSGDCLTLDVNNANDKFIIGFFKTVNVTPKKI